MPRLSRLSARRKLPYADQFHDLLDVWGKNKPREGLSATLPALKQAATDDSVAGVEQLRAFLQAQEKSPTKGVSMQGDPVHPGPPGQLMMAAALLKDLGAEGFVSSANLDAAGKAEAKGCMITDINATGGGIAFDRIDECLPFPVPDDARVVLPMAPDVLSLSAYTLRVTGLKDGDYMLKIGGAPCGRFSSKDLTAGINLTSLPAAPKAKLENPIAVQMRAVLSAVSAKEGLVSAWRGLSQKAHAKDADPKLKDDLAAFTKKVEAADAKIREAAKPQKLHFEVVVAGK